jgi:hypothetical protein
LERNQIDLNLKKTDTILKVMSAIIFCAMVAYLSVYMVNRFLNPVQTALAVTATMSESSAMSGLVVRDELVIKSSEEYIDITVSDGEKVSAGQMVAVSYSSQEALDRAMRLRSLQKQIEEAESSLSASNRIQTTGNRDQSIYSAIVGLSAALRSDSYAGIDTQESALASIIFRTETTDTSEDYLTELTAAYNELQATAAGDTQEITVGQSGTFSSVVDGFEGVSPEYAQELTPSALRELIAADRVVEAGSFGKLISSYYWYYAAIVSQEDASRLVSGMTVQLSFGRYYSGLLTAKVMYVGRAEGHEQLVLFRMDRGFSEMLAVRSVSAELVYSEYTGLRVPLKALYRYYAGYVSEEDAELLEDGQSLTLTLGGVDYDAVVSEIGTARAYGDLPEGVESGSEEDTRPKRCLVVFYWPWEDVDAPDFSDGNGKITLSDGEDPLFVTNYYDYDPTVDRMCVFTMTGLQAERKKVELLYAGEEYGLVSSEGDDALREGNEIIVQAKNLHDGMVFR